MKLSEKEGREDKRRLLVTEMAWLRRKRGRRRREKIINDITRQELVVEEIVVLKIQRRVKWFGHVERMNKEMVTLSKTGTLNRGRKQKIWLDNVREDLRGK